MMRGIKAVDAFFVFPEPVHIPSVARRSGRGRFTAQGPFPPGGKAQKQACSGLGRATSLQFAFFVSCGQAGNRLGGFARARNSNHEKAYLHDASKSGPWVGKRRACCPIP